MSVRYLVLFASISTETNKVRDRTDSPPRGKKGMNTHLPTNLPTNLPYFESDARTNVPIVRLRTGRSFRTVRTIQDRRNISAAQLRALVQDTLLPLRHAARNHQGANAIPNTTIGRTSRLGHPPLSLARACVRAWARKKRVPPPSVRVLAETIRIGNVQMKSRHYGTNEPTTTTL